MFDYTQYDIITSYPETTIDQYIKCNPWSSGYFIKCEPNEQEIDCIVLKDNVKVKTYGWKPIITCDRFMCDLFIDVDFNYGDNKLRSETYLQLVEVVKDHLSFTIIILFVYLFTLYFNFESMYKRLSINQLIVYVVFKLSILILFLKYTYFTNLSDIDITVFNVRYFSLALFLTEIFDICY
jgi:hypothetical protein